MHGNVAQCCTMMTRLGAIAMFTAYLVRDSIAKAIWLLIPNKRTISEVCLKSFSALKSTHRFFKRHFKILRLTMRLSQHIQGFWRKFYLFRDFYFHDFIIKKLMLADHRLIKLCLLFLKTLLYHSSFYQ